MGNVRRGLREQRAVPRNFGRALDLAMAGKGADRNLAGRDRYSRQAVDAGDVDEDFGRGQPQVQDRDQALAACKNTCAVAVFREQVVRFCE